LEIKNSNKNQVFIYMMVGKLGGAILLDNHRNKKRQS
jgi:hypothetical protein